MSTAKREKYTGSVMADYLNAAEASFAKYPRLNEIFGADWVKNLLQGGQLVSEVPPIFWQFARPEDDSFVKVIFDFIDEDPKSRKRFIEQLKAEQDESIVRGLLRELQAYHHIRFTKKQNVQWRPIAAVSGKDYHPDLKIDGDRPLYIEVFSVGKSANEIREDRIYDQLHASINKIENNPYPISLFTNRPIGADSVPKIVQFITDIIPTLDIRSGNTQRVNYAEDNGGAIEILFHARVPERDGAVLGYSRGVRHIVDDARIKNRILSKLDNIQLPPKVADSRHVNGYLIFLDTFMASDFFQFLNAILGQQAITFSAGKPDSTWTHVQNGIIHHPKWRDGAAATVDFFLGVIAKPSEPLTKENCKILVAEEIGIEPEEILDRIV